MQNLRHTNAGSSVRCWLWAAWEWRQYSKIWGLRSPRQWARGQNSTTQSGRNVPTFQTKLLTASFRVTENLILSTWRWRQWGFLEMLVCLYKSVLCHISEASQLSLGPTHSAAGINHCLCPGKQNVWSFAVIPRWCLSMVRYEQYVPIPLRTWNLCKLCSCRSLKILTVFHKTKRFCDSLCILVFVHIYP